MAAGAAAIRAVQQATSTIPVVAASDDLVGEGLVTSLARPGGNTTGVSILGSELNAKRLGLLKEAVPGLARIASLWDPATGKFHLSALEDAARSLRVEHRVLEVREPGDVARAVDAAVKARVEALNVLASPFLAAQDAAIIELAAKHRLPVIYQWTEAVEAGGLMGYGPI